MRFFHAAAVFLAAHLVCHNNVNAFQVGVIQQQAGHAAFQVSSSTMCRRHDGRPIIASPYSDADRTGGVAPLFMGRAAAVRASTKAKTDAKKAKTNAVFGKRIIMAVKEGGSPDPVANQALAVVIKQAKANSVPVENINRAIKRASEGSAGDFKESIFEAYGHGGASFVINVLTDNNNRATSDVRSAVNRREGKMAESGSVLFMYDKRGMIEVEAELEEESVLEAAIEAGCDDMELVPGDVEGTTVIYTGPKEAALMLDAVKSLGIADDAIKMSLVHVSKAPVECDDKDFEKNMEIVDALEALDDVDSVQHNMSN